MCGYGAVNWMRLFTPRAFDRSLSHIHFYIYAEDTVGKSPNICLFNFKLVINRSAINNNYLIEYKLQK